MAARGTEAKKSLTTSVLNAFQGAFLCDDGKTIRVPMVENGETVEIKITLTAAKDVLGGSVSTPAPQQATVQTGFGAPLNAQPVEGVPFVPDNAEPTQEEKEMVARLLAAVK